MAIVGHLHKISFGGALCATEEWSCGLHFLSPDSSNINSNMLYDAVSQWMTRATSLTQSTAKLEYLKANEINPVTGWYTDANNSHTYYYEPLVSGTLSVSPPQVTVALSLVTGLSRGRSSKGRIYPPTTDSFGGMGLTDDGHISVAAATGMAVSGAQLITDVNGAASGDVVIFSKIGQMCEPVIGVRVGNVIDTQQRRRRSLVETYVSELIS